MCAFFCDYFAAEIIRGIAKKTANRFGAFQSNITGTLRSVPNISVNPILKFSAQFCNRFSKLENKTRFTQ